MKCIYNYHNDLHPDVCIFETLLDEYLVADSKLTNDAQKLRDSLIIGVNRMFDKVNNFKKIHK